MTVVRTAAVITLVALISLGAIYTLTIPSQADAISHAEQFDIEDTITWSCPLDGFTQHSISLGITEAEFEHSMSRDVLRYGTILDKSPVRFIEPNDPYVQKIAHHISSLFPEDQWTLASLYFVQSGIQYAYDSDLYGVDEYEAFPLETLYLQRGDCEDVSVLLCSIYGALDIDSVLLQWVGHVAVGVYEDDEILYCEATYDTCHPYTKIHPFMDGDPEIYHYGDGNVGRYVSDFAALYRNLIDRVTGSLNQ